MPTSREAIFAGISPAYSGLRHLLITSAVTLCAIVVALYLVRRPTGTELLVVPLAFILANGIEWLLHRDLLHRRSGIPWLGTAYERHALTHHIAFQHDTMAAPSRREWRWVLFPAPALFGLLALCGCVAALFLLATGNRNLALLLFAAQVGFYLVYEWLHLSYHQPVDSRVGRFPLVKVLRRHHQLHHDPALSRRYNFNITLPLFDLFLGTMARETHKSVDSSGQAV